MLKKINKYFEEVLCTFFLSVVFVSVITQVVLRFGFSSAAVWAEETAVYGLIFATYLGASLGIKRREHVRITFIVLSFPKKLKIAHAAQLEYQRALGLFPHKSSGWQPRTLSCSALNNIGIDTVWEMIQEYVAQTKANGHFTHKRKNQNLSWMEKTVTESLKETLLLHPEVLAHWNELKEKVTSEKITPIAAAEILVDLALQKRNG